MDLKHRNHLDLMKIVLRRWVPKMEGAHKVVSSSMPYLYGIMVPKLLRIKEKVK